MNFDFSRFTLFSTSILACFLTGCTAHYAAVRVTEANRASIEGFRYFRPKPYLLVTNMTTGATPQPAGAKSDGNDNSGSKGMEGSGTKPKDKPDKPNDAGANPAPPNAIITVQLLWLPDPEEEYAVVLQGHSIGTFDGKLQLDNGWMLTSINEQSDAKVAETLTAFSGLLSNVFSAAGLGAAPAASKSVSAQAEAQKPLAPFLYLFRVDLKEKTLEPIETHKLNDLLLKLKCMGPCAPTPIADVEKPK